MQRSFMQLTKRLAQLVEQWTSNLKVGGWRPFGWIGFGCFTEFVLISFIKPDVRKTINICYFCSICLE